MEPLVDDIDAWNHAGVPGHEMKRLVAERRRLIDGLPALGVALPDHRDVRATLVGDEGDVSEPTSAMAVVDFDIGGMVLPIGIDDWQLRSDTWTPVEEVAALMVDKLVHAATHRRKLLRRERKIREGFERDVARLGGGAAPLWLRVEPLRFSGRVSDLFRLPYVALDVRLDMHQVWPPPGSSTSPRPRSCGGSTLGVEAAPPQRRAHQGDGRDWIGGLDQRRGASADRAGGTQPGGGVS